MEDDTAQNASMTVTSQMSNVDSTGSRFQIENIFFCPYTQHLVMTKSKRLNEKLLKGEKGFRSNVMCESKLN